MPGPYRTAELLQFYGRFYVRLTPNSSLLTAHSSLSYRLSHFSSISLAGSDTAMATAAL